MDEVHKQARETPLKLAGTVGFAVETEDEVSLVAACHAGDNVLGKIVGAHWEVLEGAKCTKSVHNGVQPHHHTNKKYEC